MSPKDNYAKQQPGTWREQCIIIPSKKYLHLAKKKIANKNHCQISVHVLDQQQLQIFKCRTCRNCRNCRKGRKCRNGRTDELCVCKCALLFLFLQRQSQKALKLKGGWGLDSVIVSLFAFSLLWFWDEMACPKNILYMIILHDFYYLYFHMDCTIISWPSRIYIIISLSE